MKNWWLRSILLGALATFLGTAQPAPIRPQGHNATAYQAMMVIAIFAGRESEAASKAGRTQDAFVWQIWSGLYEYSALTMPDNWNWTHALRANSDFCRSQASAYSRAGNARYANFYMAMDAFYLDLWDQLEKGPKVVANFPRSMRGPFPGAPGTPWDPKALEIIQALSLMKGTGWKAIATPSAGEKVCSRCNGARQWRCSNCLGSGAAGFLKSWTGDKVTDTSYDRGRTGFISKSCYQCNGVGWIRCVTCNGRGVTGR